MSSPTAGPNVGPNADLNADGNVDPNAAPNADLNAVPNVSPNVSLHFDPSASPNVSPSAGPNTGPSAGPNTGPSAGPTQRVSSVSSVSTGSRRRRTPKLVLTIISSSQYYHPWTREKFTEDFQAGIIQAANLTEMWILTDGLDKGVSKLIGDAASTEMKRRKNMELNPLHIKNIMSERLPRLNIFGIVPKSAVVYADVLNGQVKTVA
nr:hypothetical protein BaRGS_002688 [Batillaria attramentaria]